ncbi:putative ribosomal RNA small subunit methyltransferase A, partial [Clarias magur]
MQRSERLNDRKTQRFYRRVLTQQNVTERPDISCCERLFHLSPALQTPNPVSGSSVIRLVGIKTSYRRRSN